MGAPVGAFYEVAAAAATADLDTSGERVAYTGDGVVDDSGSYNLSFGSVNIGAGAANSELNALIWHVSNWDGNVSITNFRFWVTENFVQVESHMKWVHCALDPTSEWVPSAVIADYSAAPNGGWANMEESEPGSANIVGADGSSTTITAAAPDTLEVVVMYAAIAASETLGIYTGISGSYDLQFTLKFDYV